MAGIEEQDDLIQGDDMEPEEMTEGVSGRQQGQVDLEFQQKVMLQQQMLEAERQKEVTAINFPPPPAMPQSVPQPIPQNPEEGMSRELLHKVMQQQQMLEIEKIREHQQIIQIERPQIMLIEAQQPGQPVSAPPPMPPTTLGPPGTQPAPLPPPPQLATPTSGPPGPPHPPGPMPVGVPPPPASMPPTPPTMSPQDIHPPLHGVQPPPPHIAPPPGSQHPPPRQPPPQRLTQPSVGEGKAPHVVAAERAPQPKEIRLPQALEKVLEFKNVRAQEVGVSPEELEKMEKPTEEDGNEEADDEAEEEYTPDVYEEEEEPEKEPTQPATKETKNKKRKKKKKKAKRSRLQEQRQIKNLSEGEKKEDVQIEYVQEQLDLDPMDPNYHTFAMIFEAFKISEPEKPKELPKIDERKEEMKRLEESKMKAKSIMDDDDDDEDEMPPEDDTPKISKKKLKKMTRLSVAQLKQLVTRPDVVEMQDVTARDPRLLVQLKATRNTVPVPRHWCYKRKYLQGKRGIEKPPFELPDFIKATGIQEMRAALAEKEDQKTLKAKMRERVRPKMGKIDIDYQKLHDAFFKYQTKPKMTIHGDLYYEGKEFETRLKEKKPGNLSDDLRIALGMPVGPNADKVPPPWLIAMQRYGPPPSYPNLKVPGLNAPIPESCSFGYHAGGWGKPPVDESGKPLYGDVFGTQSGDFPVPIEEEEIDKSHWGELESESESEEESEESSEEEDQTGLVTPAEGLVTPSGMTSIPIGVETPEMIELRKRRIEDAMDQGGDTPALYTILPEKKTAVGGAMMGSAHVYDVSAVTTKKVGDKIPTEGVEVSLNPEELDLDTAAMQAKYDQTVREQQSQLEKEDLSDMVAEHAAKQKKRKKQQQDGGRSAKKYKEFKF